MKLPHKGKREYLLLLFVIIVFLFILEIFLIILKYPVYGFSEGLFEKDDKVGYRLASNYSGLHHIYGRKVEIETNSKGMRDFRDYIYEKGKKRVLILGDSYSFGNGVGLEESFPEILRKSFNEKVEIINLAVPGYDLNNEYAVFMKEGKKYEADIVLIQFALNDFGRHQIIEANGEVKIEEGTSYCVDKKGFLIGCEKGNVRELHLFLLKNLRVYNFFYSKSRFILSPLINKYWQKNVPLYFQERNEGEYREAYDGCYSIMKKFKENTNATIILLIGPSVEDFVSKEKIKKTYSLDYLVDTSQIKEDIVKIADYLNIRVVRIEFDDVNLFLKVDKHWTPRGHEMIADVLYAEINKALEKNV